MAVALGPLISAALFSLLLLGGMHLAETLWEPRVSVVAQIILALACLATLAWVGHKLTKQLPQQ